MALDPAAVTSRSNSDLTTIGMVADNVGLSTPERMSLILAITREWDAATHNSTERHRASRVTMKDHYERMR